MICTDPFQIICRKYRVHSFCFFRLFCFQPQCENEKHFSFLFRKWFLFFNSRYKTNLERKRQCLSCCCSPPPLEAQVIRTLASLHTHLPRLSGVILSLSIVLGSVCAWLCKRWAKVTQSSQGVFPQFDWNYVFIYRWKMTEFTHLAAWAYGEPTRPHSWDATALRKQTSRNDFTSKLLRHFLMDSGQVEKEQNCTQAHESLHRFLRWRNI